MSAAYKRRERCIFAYCCIFSSFKSKVVRILGVLTLDSATFLSPCQRLPLLIISQQWQKIFSCSYHPPFNLNRLHTKKYSLLDFFNLLFILIFPRPKSTDFDILHFRRLLPPAITVLASHRVKLFPTLDETSTSPKMKIKLIRGAVQASKENLNIIFYKIFLKKNSLFAR